MFFKNRFITFIIVSLIILSACSATSPQSEIYNHLEESVSLEKEFELQQDKIMELEKKEQEIFKQITILGPDDLDEIKELANEAKEIIEERLEKVMIEEESMQDSREEFIKTKEIIERLKEDDVTEKADEMYEEMIIRYEVYEDLNKEYKNALTLEEELYTIIGAEDTEQEDVIAHIEKINDSYNLVLELNEEFNDTTVKYNTLKKDFYNIANINAEYKKEE